MKRYGSWPVTVKMTVRSASKLVRMTCKASANEACCWRSPLAVTFNTIEFSAQAGGFSDTGDANKKMPAWAATMNAAQMSRWLTLRIDATRSPALSTHRATEKTRSWPGSVESTSHMNTNAGAIHRSQNAHHRERTARRSASRLMATAGPMT